MKSNIFKAPQTICAFHQSNIITHFCRNNECLLPLCRDCLPIHRKQHASKQSQLDILTIQQQNFNTHQTIRQQIILLQQTFAQIIKNINYSNQLHIKLKNTILLQKDTLIHAIALYYDSLIRQVDLNSQRRYKWVQEITELYHSVQQELVTIKQRLRSEKHLRTIIMWNRLRPQEHVIDIHKQSKRQLQSPSIIPCDIQQIISLMSEAQSMVVLDLQGDMGFSQLSKILYTLRFGPEQSVVSNSNITNKGLGISLISKGSTVKGISSKKLNQSKSADKL